MSEATDDGDIPMNSQTTQAASDAVIFEGRAGQIVNFGHYMLGVLMILVLCYAAIEAPAYIPPSAGDSVSRNLMYFIGGMGLLVVLYLTYRYLLARMDRYWVTSQRLKQRVGVLNFKRKNLELYRVKDLEVQEPFFYRLFGAGDVVLVSSDLTDPQVRLTGIPNPAETADRLRDLVEEARRVNGVREID